jgi:hypothetical protein
MSRNAPMNGKGRGGRGPRLRRILCRLVNQTSRDVEVIFVVGKRDDDQRIQFRRLGHHGFTVEVKLVEVFQAKLGNVELSKALDRVEAQADVLTRAVDQVRESRQFHLYERNPDGTPRLAAEVDAEAVKVPGRAEGDVVEFPGEVGQPGCRVGVAPGNGQTAGGVSGPEGPGRAPFNFSGK